MIQNAVYSSVPGSGYPAGLLRLDYRSALDGVEDWAFVLPPATGVSTWVVSIHGFDGRGNQLYIRSTLKNIWLPQYRKRGWGVLSPTLRDNAWMNDAATADMDDLLTEMRQRFGARQFVFSSGSMGATSNLIYGLKRPDNVCAIVARAPATDLSLYHRFCREHQGCEPMLKEVANSLESAFGGTPAAVPDVYAAHSAMHHLEVFRHLPLAVCHGTADTLIPVEQSRRFVGALAEHPSLCYAEVPGGDHESPFALGYGSDSQYDFLSWFNL